MPAHRDPYKGIGKPEPLKQNLKRSLVASHHGRSIALSTVSPTSESGGVLQCRFHYE